MENPNTWGDLERAIHDAIRELNEELSEAGGPIYGPSLPRRIADKIRALGYIKTDLKAGAARCVSYTPR